jgi:hypothetical protein
MKTYKFILTLIFVLCYSMSFSQLKQEPISIVKRAGAGTGFRFYKNNKQLNEKELTLILKSNELAFQKFKSARANSTYAWLLGLTGSLIASVSLAQEKTDLAIGAVGLGMMVAAIPLYTTSNKRTRSAIDTYNNGLNKSPTGYNYKIDFGITRNGVGLTMNF